MRYIRNHAQLLASGNIPLRTSLLAIAEAALASADPGRAARQAVALDGNRLSIDGIATPLTDDRRIFVIGAGKASFPIAQAIDDIVGFRIHAGLVICKHGQQGQLRHIELRTAAHPLPDEASLAGARDTLALLRDVRPGDIVLACFTGGSSSLFVAPVAGITLADKAETSRILLTCGANIVEINAVRKHLSRVKGGRLARALPPGTHLINLTVSDVIGDALDYITDPTVADTSGFADARATLDRYDLWDRLPAAVTGHLRAAPPAAATVKALPHLHTQDVLLESGDAACHGAAAAARAIGITPLLLSTMFEGESRELGRSMAAIARQIRRDGQPVAAPCVLIGGGETIVRIANSGGSGGPNQEYAAAVALELAGDRGFAALGLDTDGTDGPTDLAGAIVDGGTSDAAHGAGLDLHDALKRHDVTPLFKRLDAGIVTGSTGTNVNDLKLLLLDSPL
jgi:glycerate 2-kinase